jgi:ribonuclease D
MGRVVTTAEQLAEACVRFADAPYIAIDTEFMRDTTYWPKLCLLQAAIPGFAVAIDPLAPGLDLKPFYDFLAGSPSVKVFHAARQDIEIFYHQAGMIPSPLFDTQVAAMVCGFGDSAAYETLVRELAHAQIDKSSRFTDWSRRPLTDKQLDYALSDVTHLCKVYESLLKQLDKSGRSQWLEEELDIRQTAHLATNFRGQGLAQVVVFVFKLEDHFLFVLGAVHADVNFGHQEVGRHFNIGYGDQFIAAINDAAFFGEDHAEVASYEFAYLLLTDGFHNNILKW